MVSLSAAVGLEVNEEYATFLRAGQYETGQKSCGPVRTCKPNCLYPEISFKALLGWNFYPNLRRRLFLRSIFCDVINPHIMSKPYFFGDQFFEDRVDSLEIQFVSLNPSAGHRI